MAKGDWNRRTEQEIKDIIENLGYIFIEAHYNKWNQRKVITKDRLGYKYDILLNDYINKNRIPDFVALGNPFSLENISLWLKANRPEFKLCKDNVYRGSGEKLKFYHTKCGEYFLAAWESILDGQGCGICDGRQVGKYNNLKYCFPELAKEWHPTKNGNLTPNNITYGSEKKVWWLCPQGHEYYSQVKGRTKGSACKQCSDEQKESLIASELKHWCLNNYKHTCIEYKIVRNPRTSSLLSYDVYIPHGENPELNGYYIEIHGHQHYVFTIHWHKTKERFEESKYRDKIKKKFAHKNGSYIEIDLRKIKTVYDAIEYIEAIINEQ